MKSKSPHILTIIGPTASGKTNLACAVAKEIGAEIISGDSRQVYRYMDIGTGKDLNEYTVEGIPIPYHLIDIHDPGYKYNIAEFQLDFIEVAHQLLAQNKKTILCGGSGLYIEAALKGNSFLGIPMDKQVDRELGELSLPELQRRFDLLSPRVKSALNNETKRRIIRAIVVDDYLKKHPDFKTVDAPDFDFTIIGVDIDREKRRQKISKRLSDRMNAGLIEEVEWLLKNYLTPDDLDYYGLEYKWVGMYLRNEISKKELFEGLEIAIHQFAKRQMTWFRRMERNGYMIHWISSELSMEEKVKLVRSFYPD